MLTQINQELIDQYVQMGFRVEIIKLAWEVIYIESEMLDTLIQLSGSQIQNKKDEDQLKQVLHESQKIYQQPDTQTFEIISPDQRKRIDRIPCGLKNIGNTCYFNSLLQTYFFNSQFVKTIINFQPPQQIQQGKQSQSIQLVQNLQNLFINMIGSDKKYVDPSEVVKRICNEFGNVFPIGDQQDVGEFNYYFLSRIGEGLTKTDNQINKIQDNLFDTQSSILKQKSSIIYEKDIVSQLFFCNVFHQLQFQQGFSQQIRESSELFNYIPLVLKDGNLYDSFDSFAVDKIDNLSNDFNERVQGIQYNWIKFPPERISFQIQRVAYSQEKKILIKQNDKFTFDEEIYLDRYLLENREKYIKIRNQNQELKSQQQTIKLQLLKLTDFNNNQQDIQDVIPKVIQFMQMQIMENNDHAYNFVQPDEQANIQMLQQYSQKILQKKLLLQKRFNDLENKIQANYNELKKQKYILQSILIHDGQANSGHYYTYIKDFRLEQWFKFNDIDVNVETKEKVFQDAFGIKDGVNAYLLIYIRIDIVQQELDSQMRTYRISSENQYLNDTYGSYLNYIQRNQLLKENQLFEKQINQQISTKILDNLIESYQIRYEFIDEQYKIISNSVQSEIFKPLITLNFPIFIKSKIALLGKDCYDNILKWVIIDSALREVTPDNSGYFGVQISKDFQNQLMSKFIAKFNEFKRPTQFLTQKEQEDFHQLTQEYNQYIGMASLASILLDIILKKDFQHALSVLHRFSQMVKELDSQNYFYKLACNFSKLIPIIIMCKMIPIQANVNLLELELLQAYLSFQHFKIHSAIYWDTQISIMMYAILQNHDERQIMNIINKFENNVKDPNYIKQIEEIKDDVGTQQTVLIANYDIYYWSTNMKQDILFDKLINNYKDLKNYFEPFTRIQKAIKESSCPLMKQELEKLIF